MFNSKENFEGSGFGRFAHPTFKPLSWPERKYHSEASPESQGSELNKGESVTGGESGDSPEVSEKETLPEINKE